MVTAAAAARNAAVPFRGQFNYEPCNHRMAANLLAIIIVGGASGEQSLRPI